MLKAKNIEGKYTLVLDDGDYGIGVAIELNNFKFTDADSVIFTIRRKRLDKDIVIQKQYDNIQDNKVLLLISKEESELLTENIYHWELEIYRNNAFLMTIGKNLDFIVEGGY